MKRVVELIQLRNMRSPFKSSIKSMYIVNSICWCMKTEDEKSVRLTYFLIMERSGVMMGFPMDMAFTKISGKDCSSRKDPYITRSAAPRGLPTSSSTAKCFTVPLG